jgi:CRP-like cAMP-binding protein
VLVEGCARVVASGGVTLDVLGPGDLVGELSLLAGGVRTATVLADGPLVTVRMDRAGLESLLDTNPGLAARVGDEALRRLDERKLADFVRRMLGSAAVPISELRPHLTWLWLRAGEALYRQGDEGDSGFLVVSGRFVILAGDEDSIDGAPTVIGEVGQDQFVGESGVFEGRDRRVTLVATRDSLVAQITRASAVALLTQHPELVAPAMLEISRRSRRDSTASPKRTIALAVTTTLDRSTFGSRLVAEIGRHGTCAHVWSDWIDSHMNQTGFANAEPGGLASSRLSQLLHEVELAHDHAVHETDPVWSALSERVARESDLLVDGGVLNNLPADLMRADVEAGTVVAVDVAPPSGPRARRDIALSVSGWEALRAMAGRGKPAYPGITALLMRTMIAGSIRERARMLSRGDADLYLDLDLRGVSLLDFDKVPSTVAAGYEAAMPRLEAWPAGQER